MSLQDQLDRLRASELAKTPPQVLEVQQQAFELLTRTGIGAAALSVGDRVPDFELPDLGGRMVRLRELREQGAVILSFFRGGWCPFCSMELRAYQKLVESIEESGSSIVAISPERADLLAEAAANNELSFPVLSDADNRVAHAFGLVYTVPEVLRPVYEGFGLDLPARHASTTFELPIPATYLVDSSGIVRQSYVDLDHTQRGDPEEFLRGLRELRAS